MQDYQHLEMATPLTHPIVIKKEGSEEPGPGFVPIAETSKRRVNSNACQPCRKRKSKCDGGKPQCRSCATLHFTDCHYDLDKDLRRKGALRQEIQSLRELNENYRLVLETICHAGQPHANAITNLLRTQTPIEVVAHAVRSGTVPEIVAPIPPPYYPAAGDITTMPVEYLAHLLNEPLADMGAHHTGMAMANNPLVPNNIVLSHNTIISHNRSIANNIPMSNPDLNQSMPNSLPTLNDMRLPQEFYVHASNVNLLMNGGVGINEPETSMGPDFDMGMAGWVQNQG